MRRLIIATLPLVLAAGIGASPALAENLKPQTVPLANVSVESVTNGYRASKIIGSTVVNDNGDKVGAVDDIVTGQDRQSSFAVLSVGGFLGVGSKLVVVPFSSLKVSNGKIMLPGATKDALKELPSFNYNKG